MKRRSVLIGLIAAAGAGWGVYRFGRAWWVPVVQWMRGRRTVQDVVDELGPRVEPLWRDRCSREGVPYPPPRLRLVGLKRERRLECWASASPEAWVLIASYPIVAASGGPGPKLREGDRQVPEGVYRVEGLNPNSAYHLSIKVGYPNDSDAAHAAAEGRSDPGGDIFIHGKDLSIGCLAIGDDAIEELFVLVEQVGITSADVVIAPHDLRRDPAIPAGEFPQWYQERCAEIRDALPE